MESCLSSQWHSGIHSVSKGAATNLPILLANSGETEVWMVVRAISVSLNSRVMVMQGEQTVFLLRWSSSVSVKVGPVALYGWCIAAVGVQLICQRGILSLHLKCVWNRWNREEIATTRYRESEGSISVIIAQSSVRVAEWPRLVHLTLCQMCEVCVQVYFQCLWLCSGFAPQLAAGVHRLTSLCSWCYTPCLSAYLPLYKE